MQKSRFSLIITFLVSIVPSVHSRLPSDTDAFARKIGAYQLPTKKIYSTNQPLRQALIDVIDNFENSPRLIANLMPLLREALRTPTRQHVTALNNFSSKEKLNRQQKQAVKALCDLLSPSAAKWLLALMTRHKKKAAVSAVALLGLIGGSILAYKKFSKKTPQPEPDKPAPVVSPKPPVYDHDLSGIQRALRKYRNFKKLHSLFDQSGRFSHESLIKQDSKEVVESIQKAQQIKEKRQHRKNSRDQFPNLEKEVLTFLSDSVRISKDAESAPLEKQSNNLQTRLDNLIDLTARLNDTMDIVNPEGLLDAPLAFTDQPGVYKKRDLQKEDIVPSIKDLLDKLRNAEKHLVIRQKEAREQAEARAEAEAKAKAEALRKIATIATEAAQAAQAREQAAAAAKIQALARVRQARAETERLKAAQEAARAAAAAKIQALARVRQARAETERLKAAQEAARAAAAAKIQALARSKQARAEAERLKAAQEAARAAAAAKIQALARVRQARAETERLKAAQEAARAAAAAKIQALARSKQARAETERLKAAQEAARAEAKAKAEEEARAKAEAKADDSSDSSSEEDSDYSYEEETDECESLEEQANELIARLSRATKRQYHSRLKQVIAQLEELRCTKEAEASIRRIENKYEKKCREMPSSSSRRSLGDLDRARAEAENELENKMFDAASSPSELRKFIADNVNEGNRTTIIDGINKVVEAHLAQLRNQVREEKDVANLNKHKERRPMKKEMVEALFLAAGVDDDQSYLHGEEYAKKMDRIYVNRTKYLTFFNRSRYYPRAEQVYPSLVSEVKRQKRKLYHANRLNRGLRLNKESWNATRYAWDVAKLPDTHPGYQKEISRIENRYMHHFFRGEDNLVRETAKSVKKAMASLQEDFESHGNDLNDAAAKEMQTLLSDLQKNYDRFKESYSSGDYKVRFY